MAMSILKSSILWKIVLLLLVFAGIAGVFMPWIRFETGNSVNGTGFGNAFANSSGVSGFSLWVGVPVLVLLLLEIVFIFLKIRNAPWLHFIPPALVLLFPILFILFFSESSAAPLVEEQGFDFKFVSDANFTYGIYITITSAFLLMAASFLQLYSDEIIEEVEEAEPTTISPESDKIIVEEVLSTPHTYSPEPVPIIEYFPDPVSLESTETIEAVPEINSHDSEEKSEDKNFRLIKIALTSIIVLLIISIFVFILTNFLGNKNDQTKVIAEKTRLEKLVSSINQDIADRNYDAALLKIGKVIWAYQPSENAEYVKLFEKQRENLFKSVQDLRNLQRGDSGESTLPDYYVIATVDRAYVYSSPSYAAKTSRFIREGQSVGVISVEDNFYHISYTFDGNYIKGWVLRSEFSSSSGRDSRDDYNGNSSTYYDTARPAYDDRYEEKVSLAYSYAHKEKNWSLTLNYGGTLQFKTETSKTPYEGTWQLSNETVTIEIPNFMLKPWKFKVKRDGLYDKSNQQIWYVTSR